ncbi:MAG TPA: hypothetical protein VJL90_15285 [Pseudorhodoplanes sp.]|nr:hypothetical protein [Pseudorhodoplanes sp.]
MAAKIKRRPVRVMSASPIAIAFRIDGPFSIESFKANQRRDIVGLIEFRRYTSASQRPLLTARI